MLISNEYLTLLIDILNLIKVVFILKALLLK